MSEPESTPGPVQTFFDACAAGEATIADMDNWIDRWHGGEGPGLSLPQFLGFQPEEITGGNGFHTSLLRADQHLRDNDRTGDYKQLLTVCPRFVQMLTDATKADQQQQHLLNTLPTWEQLQDNASTLTQADIDGI